MNLLIRPKKLKGVINSIPSKSYSHRAIIAASLAKGQSVVSNLVYSEDILATIDACEALGAKIIKEEDRVIINGAGGVKRIANKVDARESGSTIRFMIPILLVDEKPITFLGKNNLVNRPLDIYFEIFKKLGIHYETEGAYLPLRTEGGLKPGTYQVKGNVSSQFITGLLFALPLLKGDSLLEITGPLESKGYLDLTLDVLKTFGIEIKNNDYESFYIKGNQSYLPHDYVIEGDYSQAAFFLGLGALGNDVKILNMNLNSLQGDKKILEDLEKLGSKITYQDGLLSASPIKLQGGVIDLKETPDLGPILSVIAGVSEGKSSFINAGRLRIKECDRITAMKEELNKLGLNVSETSETMEFSGVKEVKGSLDLDSHNDHRIAMALAVIASIATKPCLIKNAGAVKKSYPTFWDDYKLLGGDFDERP